MTTLNYTSGRRKALEAAFIRVLTPNQQAAVRELVRAECEKGEPQPEDMLYWLRLNMPVASGRIDRVLYPAD